MRVHVTLPVRWVFDCIPTFPGRTQVEVNPAELVQPATH